MKVEVKDISQSVKEVSVEVEAEEVKEAYKKVSQYFSKHVSVPGFRKGLAPIEMVRIHYRDEIRERVIDELVSKKVVQALEERSLFPVVQPKVYLQDKDKLKLDGSEPATFRVILEVMPEVPLVDTSDIELIRRVRPVKEEDIDAILGRRLEDNAVFVPIEGRKAQKGDTIFVDLEGTFIDKPSEEKIELKEVEILLGDESIDKNFSENLEGVVQDEVREFVIEYPEDFASPQLAGRKVKYRAKVLSVGQVEKAELNDDFAKEEGYESLNAMKEAVREELEKEFQKEAQVRLERELLEKLFEKYKIELPPSLVLARSKEIFSMNQKDFEKLLAYTKQSEEEFYRRAFNMSAKLAEDELKEALLFSKFAEERKIEVNEEEIEDEIKRVAGEMNLPVEAIKGFLERESGRNYKERVRDFLMRKKVISMLIDEAKITEGEWIEEKQDKEMTSEQNADQKD
ncbi:MAG: trigger factor [Pyrinomonadaceae bacterium]|nr:trigger factor [Pyrinomonadaceae bacterium]MCX7639961.1 trigger factor [Pyrinomonadaceae bacterium]MDW8304133.1 trigger factor [Acidobacteriota bacterium]